ncbi:MAG: 5'-deoxynucleotidase [Oscillospiraceae bacterium]
MHGFFAMLSRMKYINRWGLMRSARTETLSEHTLETAMLAHALIAIGNARLDRGLDVGQGVLLALYHDCGEILTGDLPTPVKYHDASIRTAYDAIEQQASARLLAMLPEDLRDSFSPYVAPDELLAVYRPYIKAADKLSALIKCIEEEKSGNAEFAQARRATLRHEALLLPEARLFIEEYLPAYSLTLDELEPFDNDEKNF